MGLVGNLGRMVGIDSQAPYKTAAQGAETGSQRFSELAALQWQRQMEGLQRALGSMGNYNSLYDRIYGTNNAPTSGANAPGAMTGLAGGQGTIGYERPANIVKGEQFLTDRYGLNFGGGANQMRPPSSVTTTPVRGSPYQGLNQQMAGAPRRR